MRPGDHTRNYTSLTDVTEVTARRHGLSRPQLYLWRERYGAGLLGGDREPAFAPVVVASEAASTM